MIPHRPLPELLLPAGGFDAGIAAFQGGADAIYLGFRNYSARKQAKNFDYLEYRRILGLARDQGKKVYVAINTVVLESEYSGLARLLSFLEKFPPDGIIFQDWGLASLIRENFPSLALHASTQTAIQTPEAARIAAGLGVARIVLPRECGLADLKRFKAEAPGLEYEVFVHGALCYSFSGLCLASGLLLGRSGNRGACAQVCRSYYRREGAPPPSVRDSGLKEDGTAAHAIASRSHEQGFWFSCRDLELVDELAALREAGASSLKVEGRMKSPEYVHAVARLYRTALDALDTHDAHVEGIEELRKEAHIAFSRSPSKAYFLGPRSENLLDAGYPGHRGVPAGKIVGYRGPDPRALVELAEPIGLRDGLSAFPEPRQGEGERRIEPLAFSVQGLVDGKTGRELGHARAGSLVEIELPSRLPSGTTLYKISSRSLDRRVPSPEEYPPLVLGLPARLTLRQEGEGGRLVLRLDSPAIALEDTDILPLARARVEGGFRRVAELFAESGDADFRLDLSLDGKASLHLADGDAPLADLFIPPSLLKKAKNRIYAELGSRLASLDEERAGKAASPHPQDGEIPPASPASLTQPPRGKIVFSYEGLPSGMPFATPGLLATGAALPRYGEWSWLPLSPLVDDWNGYEVAVLARASAELAAGRRLMVGIDALHHLPLASKLCGLEAEAEKLSFFGDIHLYIASRRSESAWLSFLPRLAFAYRYIEEEARDDGFEPPLFISRACFKRHHVSGGNCPPGCDRKHLELLSDRERRYLLVVEDCVTMLFRAQ